MKKLLPVSNGEHVTMIARAMQFWSNEGGLVLLSNGHMRNTLSSRLVKSANVAGVLQGHHI